MWEAAKYVVRVRTDLITVLGRALGDSFLQGVATFMVVFVTGWYGLSQEGAYAAILGVGIGAIAGVLILGRTSDALLGRGWLHGRVLVEASANFAAAVVFFAAFSTARSPWLSPSSPLGRSSSPAPNRSSTPSVWTCSWGNSGAAPKPSSRW